MDTFLLVRVFDFFLSYYIIVIIENKEMYMNIDIIKFKEHLKRVYDYMVINQSLFLKM